MNYKESSVILFVQQEKGKKIRRMGIMWIFINWSKTRHNNFNSSKHLWHEWNSASKNLSNVKFSELPIRIFLNKSIFHLFSIILNTSRNVAYYTRRILLFNQGSRWVRFSNTTKKYIYDKFRRNVPGKAFFWAFFAKTDHKYFS